MKYGFPIVLMLLLFLGKGRNDFKSNSLNHQFAEFLDKAPEFFVLNWKEGTSLEPKKSDLFIEVDSIGKQDVTVLLNKNEEPVLYTANIATPVCADGECKLMNIRLYWTLLGEYAGFDRYPELPLTKHDHDEFVQDDYQKLHQLLIDDKSIFGRRSIDRLVEKPIMRNVNGVDALSGATIAEVKESVVSGALYSCYVAWHLVHGEIRSKLKNHTLSVLSQNMVTDMLYSNNAEYHLFALEKLNDDQYIEHYAQIAAIFKTGIPLVRSIIAKGLPSRFKDNSELQEPFWEAFDHIDMGSRSLLLQNLDSAPSFVSDIVSAKLASMTKNQLKTFLEFLSDKELSPELLENLNSFAHSEDETLAYLAKRFIDESR